MRRELGCVFCDCKFFCEPLQAAHVGVGISGKEGLQATLASDYAIAQVVLVPHNANPSLVTTPLYSATLFHSSSGSWSSCYWYTGRGTTIDWLLSSSSPSTKTFVSILLRWVESLSKWVWSLGKWA